MRLIAATALFVFLAACTAEQAATPIFATVIPTQEVPLIGSLQTRDELLRIHATGFGPRYSVYQRSETGGAGRVVSQNLTADELAARHGNLHEALRTASAQSEGPYIDARLYDDAF